MSEAVAPFAVVPLAGIDAQIAATLLMESEREGFRFVRRLVEDFADGTNCFAEPGESLFGVFDGGLLVAVGGLNRDPYVPSRRDMGWIRRLYVLPAYRGQGIGRRLVEALIRQARHHYQILTLRTDSPQADLYYRVFGFVTPAPFPESTHFLTLSPPPNEA